MNRIFQKALLVFFIILTSAVNYVLTEWVMDCVPDEARLTMKGLVLFLCTLAAFATFSSFCVVCPIARKLNILPNDD